jgi:hypothetical protein
MRQHLADQEDLRPAAGDCCSDDFFRAAVPVHFGGVDERHAEIDPETQGGNLASATAPIFPDAPRPLPQDCDGLT